MYNKTYKLDVKNNLLSVLYVYCRATTKYHFVCTSAFCEPLSLLGEAADTNLWSIGRHRVEYVDQHKEEGHQQGHTT